MCIKLVQLSFKQKNLSASEHSILNVMAFRANKLGICWPSIASLKESTSLDRKTIQKSIQILISKKIIILTGEKTGKTKSVPVYKLNLSDPNFSISDPKNGTAKRSQFWDTERSYIKDQGKDVFLNSLDQESLSFAKAFMSNHVPLPAEFKWMEPYLNQ